MTADRLTLKNFRNLETACVEFSPGINVLIGDNAQGKTNLLEAVGFFSAGRSFRAGREKELIRFGSDTAAMSLSWRADGREFCCNVSLFEDKRKRMTLNGVELKGAAELVGGFGAVLFAPEHLNLVKEGPSGRRRFLDQALSQLKPKYLTALSEYQRILKQKNSLLRDMRRYPQLEETLGIWNEKLAAVGAYLCVERLCYLAKLQKRAAPLHSEISAGAEALELRYQTFTDCPCGDYAHMKKQLHRELEDSISRETACAMSLIGPHRDDVEILLNGKPARLYGSQGQQRSCVLSMKLAEGELIREAFGENPVFLLDDILSELDAYRQSYIIDHIRGLQVILTCCESERLVSSSDGAVFRVSGGRIERE